MTDFAEYKRLPADERDKLGFAKWQENGRIGHHQPIRPAPLPHSVRAGYHTALPARAFSRPGSTMYLTANPHADAEAYYSDVQAHQDASDAIEAEAGSALRSALAWGSGEWLGLRSIRDRMAGEVIAELAATEEGCEAITKALSTLAQIKAPEAVGAIWSLSDVWVKTLGKEMEQAVSKRTSTMC